MNRWFRRTMLILTCVAAFACIGLPMPAQGSGDDERAADFYADGRHYLDERDWERAVRAFDKVIALESTQAAGASYWKAYALGKQGRHKEALVVLAGMEADYPDSRWRRDAKALEVELSQSAGKPVRPENEEDEELKLIALGALMHMDQNRAVPMLEKILEGNSSPAMKEEALFILLQTGSPRARDLLFRIARGDSNPDLQRHALEYLGMFREEENLAFLKEIYASTSDRRIKRTIIEAYAMSEGTDELIRIAETETDEGLRREAIQALGFGDTGKSGSEAEKALLRLYESARSPDEKRQILESLAITGHTEKLYEVSRGETDPEVREAAIESLGWVDDPRVGEYLIGLYDQEESEEIKVSILQGLAVQEEVQALIKIARGEKDPDLRRQAVEMLAMVDSKEATDFLLEILDE
jgi:HEAT repeat protein